MQTCESFKQFQHTTMVGRGRHFFPLKRLCDEQILKSVINIFDFSSCAACENKCLMPPANLSKAYNLSNFKIAVGYKNTTLITNTKHENSATKAQNHGLFQQI